MENEPAAYSEPDTSVPRVKGGFSEQLAKEVVNKDQALAAYFLIALALLNISSELIAPSGNVTIYIAGAIDLLIGVCISLGLYSFLIWLKIRLIGGIVLAIILATLGGQPLLGAITIFYAGGLSLLVFGDVSKSRRITAIVILGILILLTLLGMVAIIAGVA